MGGLNDRVKRLERGDPGYSEHIVASALRRLTTEELKNCVVALSHVVDGGAPEKVAQPVVLRISRLCEEIKKEGSYG